MKGLWSFIDINWTKIDPSVNILIGENGTGKSTLMNAIYALLKNPCPINKDFYADYISIKIGDKEIRSDIEQPELSPFLVEKLNKEEDIFSYVSDKFNLMQNTDATKIPDDMMKFRDTINKLFSKAHKKIEFSDKGGFLIRDDKQMIVDPEKLSSGEKKMLIFLYKVYLSNKRPFVFLLDEPELSLSIKWQQYLIEILLDFNPNCQLFIVTHSPNIATRGWMDKVSFIEDCITNL